MRGKARHLATAFEIIAPVGTIGTLHRTEFTHNFAPVHYFHKESTVILQLTVTGNEADERFTSVGYVLSYL